MAKTPAAGPKPRKRKTPSKPKDDRSIGERSFCAALEAGRRWEPAFHRQWCDGHGEDPDAEITLRAELIRALLFVEGAHMSARRPTEVEEKNLTRFMLDPTKRYITQGLIIDWATEISDDQKDHTDVEIDEASLQALMPPTWGEEHRRRYIDEFVGYRKDWEIQRSIENRPVVTGDIDFIGGRFPAQVVMAGCIFQSIDRPGHILIDGAYLFSLNLSGSEFGEISADKVQIKGDLQAWDSLGSSMNLRGAQIDGGLFLQGASLTTETGPALECAVADISGDVLLRNGFQAHSAVSFVRATVRGNIECANGLFSAGTDYTEGENEAHRIKDEIALNLGAATVGAGLFLRGMIATGKVDLARIDVGGNVILYGAVIALSATWAGVALNLRGSKISGSLALSPQDEGDPTPCCDFVGHIDLSSAQCTTLEDAPVPSRSEQDAWLKPDGEIDLDGFTYRRIGSNSPSRYQSRLEWLHRQPVIDRKGQRFKPQPYEVLARVLRETGHNQESRKVAKRKERRLHKALPKTSLSWWFRTLFFRPSGYGYTPSPLLFTGVAVILLSVPVLAAAYRLGHISPAQPHAAVAEISAKLERQPGSRAAPICLAVEESEVLPPFNAFAYAVDAFVPLVDIDQETSWKPAREPRCEGRTTQLAYLDEVNPGLFKVKHEKTWFDRRVASFAEAGGLLWLQWLLMISGFAISALIAASLSGLIRRD